MALGELVVIFVKGKNLPNRRTLGKQDPYCVGRIGPEAHKTNVDRRGGQTPKWDHEARYTIQEGPEYKALKLSIFHDDSSKPSLIGDTVINLDEAFNIKPPDGYDQWHTLQYMGKYAGEVFLEITFYHSKKSSTRNAINPKREQEGGSEYSSTSGSSRPHLPPPTLQPARPLPPYPVSEQELLACRPAPSVSHSTSSIPSRSYGRSPVMPPPAGSPYPDDADFFRPASINLPPAGTLPHLDANSAHIRDGGAKSVQSSPNSGVVQPSFSGFPASLTPQDMRPPQRSLESLVSVLPDLGPPPNRPTSAKRRSDPQTAGLVSPNSAFPPQVLPPEPVQYTDVPPPVPHHVEPPISTPPVANSGASATTYSLVQEMEAMSIRPPPVMAGPSHRVAGPRPNSIDESKHHRVKRKPVGGWGKYAEAPDGSRSSESPQVPFSPDSFGEQDRRTSARRSRKSDSHLDRSSFAPEPSDLPRLHRIVPQTPGDMIEPGISGYAGNGRWSADQYERDLYSQWRNGNEVAKPAVPPKIPFGMSWQEYVEADYNSSQQSGYRI